MATEQQVQNFSDQRLRPRAAQSRKLLILMEDDTAAIGQVYEFLTDPEETFTDSRSDNPPNLLTKNDLLALNTWAYNLVQIMRGTLANDAAKIAACNDVAAQLPVVLKACVHAVGNE